VTPRWDTPGRPPVDRLEALPLADTRRAAVLPPHFPLKTSALQVVQGRSFRMGQSKANQGMHGLLPALLAALRALGDAPARSLTALAQR